LLLCAADLLVALDSIVVSVALPAIRHDSAPAGAIRAMMRGGCCCSRSRSASPSG
jgi:hypothetical protein